MKKYQNVNYTVVNKALQFNRFTLTITLAAFQIITIWIRRI